MVVVVVGGGGGDCNSNQGNKESLGRPGVYKYTPRHTFWAGIASDRGQKMVLVLPEVNKSLIFHMLPIRVRLHLHSGTLAFRSVSTLQLPSEHTVLEV